MLPKILDNIKVPPIKCQGIKTKLVSFISENIKWNGKGKWIEPFLGSGVVAFNIQPERALLSDTNKHIIQFYNDIKHDRIDERIVSEYLHEKGSILKEKGEDFYYETRERFNKYGGSLDFLFLNRASFNGIMRFNSKGLYNVPFGKKPDRFRKSYITKIVNQVFWIKCLIKNNDWVFMAVNFQDLLSQANEDDFVYLDPPYIGRHTDYYNSWDENSAIKLATISNQLNCGFALSMWKENKYRRNDHIENHWNGNIIKTFNHFYHVGPNENLRNAMTEALVIKKGFSNEIRKIQKYHEIEECQLNLGLEPAKLYITTRQNQVEPQ
ncbi:MAG: Dam family site-specific DNA-(adenine-N6)-methyltransferase [Bacteroidales bacterium]|nr:Dam family site-specific DNA-(adenine-N6)-methyltransferase [Bacteroidales bacterium]